MRRTIVTLSLFALALVALSSTAFAARPHARPFPGDVTVATQADAAKVTRPALALGPYTNPMDAALAIGNRLVNIQADVTEDNAGNGGADADADDGGWDFYVEGATAHPAGKSYENLYGPIARGLTDAAIATGNARLGTGAGDVFAGISQTGTGLLAFPYYRIFDADIVRAYTRWAAHTGNAALKDTIKARYDTELLVRGGAGGRARTIRNGRAGSNAGLWPWDVHMLANDAQALAAAFPGSATIYNTDVDSVSQVLLDDMGGLLGPTGWVPTNFAQNYHQTGIAGALRVFDASPRVDDNALATAMRDTLVNGQLPDGSWGVSYGGTFYPGDAQTTAYAVLALMEYSKRHSEASSRAAAFAGQQWLMGVVGAGGDVDDGGGEYAESDAEVLQALLTGDDVTPGPAPTCITTDNACISVPVVFNRIDATPVRGYSVTFTLSGGLSLCGTEVDEGTYLSAVSASRHFEVINNGGGSYTVDCAILGATAGATGSGTLFTVKLAGTGTGTGTVTINSVTVRNLTNGPVSGVPGAALAVTIDHTAPSAISNLAASQWITGNDGDGTTKIDLTWAALEAGASVEIYRKGFGSYPEYDDAGGSVPVPVGYPPAGWTPVTTSATGTSYTDEPATRDFWYYVAFVRDVCDNVSAISNQTGGTLNYHLGDVAPSGGDNKVLTVDVSDLGFNYGATLVLNDPVNYLDVGPTTDFSVNARPTTDNKIQFEDLMMFAINHGVVSAPQFRAAPVAAAVTAVSLDVPKSPAAGALIAVNVRLDAAGDVQGLSLELGWDASVAEPVSVEAGALLTRQAGMSVALSSHPGNVDLAVLGTGLTLTGSGDAAVVTFRMKRSGDPAIVLRSVEARDVANRSVPIGGPVAAVEVPSARTGLGLIYPNPMSGAATIHFALQNAGPARIAVFDLSGRRVRTLLDGTMSAGSRSVSWDGRGDAGVRMAPGFYVIRLEAGQFTQSRRVHMVR